MMRGRKVKLIDGDNSGDLDLLYFGFLAIPYSAKNIFLLKQYTYQILLNKSSS